MTTQQKLIKSKLNLLELNSYLGNVSEGSVKIPSHFLLGAAVHLGSESMKQAPSRLAFECWSEGGASQSRNDHC